MQHRGRDNFICVLNGYARWALLLAAAFLLQACSQPSNTPPPADRPAFEQPLPAPTGEVVLTITGKLTRTNTPQASAAFDRQMLMALPHKTLDTHTSVTDGVHHFKGVLMRDLLQRVGATGSHIKLRALNDYVIEVPREDFQQFDVIAAWSMDGVRFTPRDKGPLWVVYPRDQYPQLRDIRYDYRWVWQLTHINVQ